MTHTHEMENYATADRILTGIARIAGIGIALSERRQSSASPQPAGRRPLTDGQKRFSRTCVRVMVRVRFNINTSDHKTKRQGYSAVELMLTHSARAPLRRQELCQLIWPLAPGERARVTPRSRSPTRWIACSR